MQTVTDLIERFGGLGPFSEETGIKYHAAAAMKKRNSVQPEHWKLIEAHAKRLNLEGIDRYSLCDLTLLKFDDVELKPVIGKQPARPLRA